MFSGFKPNQYEGRKNINNVLLKLLLIQNYGYKMKSTQQTDSKLHRIRSSRLAGLKHCLINVDAEPVLIKFAWKQHCFNVCFFMSQFVKIRNCCKCHHFKRVSGGRCSLVFSCSQARKIKFLLSGVSSCERNLRLMSICICEVWSANALV